MFIIVTFSLYYFIQLQMIRYFFLSQIKENNICFRVHIGYSDIQFGSDWVFRVSDLLVLKLGPVPVFFSFRFGLVQVRVDRFFCSRTEIYPNFFGTVSIGYIIHKPAKNTGKYLYYPKIRVLQCIKDE